MHSFLHSMINIYTQIILMHDGNGRYHCMQACALHTPTKVFRKAAQSLVRPWAVIWCCTCKGRFMSPHVTSMFLCSHSPLLRPTLQRTLALNIDIVTGSKCYTEYKSHLARYVQHYNILWVSILIAVHLTSTDLRRCFNSPKFLS